MVHIHSTVLFGHKKQKHVICKKLEFILLSKVNKTQHIFLSHVKSIKEKNNMKVDGRLLKGRGHRERREERVRKQKEKD